MMAMSVAPRCPACSTAVAFYRWFSQCAQDGALHTRCNGCHDRIRVFIPWYVRVAIVFGPILLAAHLQHAYGHTLDLLLISCLPVCWALGVPLGYSLFGHVTMEATR